MSNQSFATLFRRSPFASLPKTSPISSSPSSVPTSPSPSALPTRQSLSAPRAHRARGDWGLKHSLPSDLPLSFIAVKEFDHTWTKDVEYESASERVFLLRRWKETFEPLPEGSLKGVRARAGDALNPISSTQTDINKGDERVTRPIDTLSSEEYLASLKQARQLRAQLNRDQSSTSPSTSTTTRDKEWFQHLSLSVPDITGNTPVVSTLLRTTKNGKSPIHGPFYSSAKPTPLKTDARGYFLEPESDTRVEVKGRILNRVANGMSVGIQGVVAMSGIHDLGLELEASREDVRDFVVDRADWTSDVPDVAVSVKETLHLPTLISAASARSGEARRRSEGFFDALGGRNQKSDPLSSASSLFHRDRKRDTKDEGFGKTKDWKDRSFYTF
ncbi:mitochondrial ribosomal protein subunit-domain-containing protein [Gaertneriomyces semiglobifer]|nr:mitochondrial ribosomal protein subunit-domain-containing protein [Gaertneriomyces semiglobifer]